MASSVYSPPPISVRNGSGILSEKIVKVTFVPLIFCTNPLSAICSGVSECHWLQIEMMSIESGALCRRVW